MTKRITLLLILCFVTNSFGISRVAPALSTYQGKQITPTSLPLLMQPLPQEDLATIKAWRDVPLHKATINGLVALNWPLAGITGNFARQQQGINALLLRQGMPNKSSFNYIFTVPGTNYIVRFAGVLGRVKNLLVYTDKTHKASPRLQDMTPDSACDAVITEQPDTFQTVSLAAHYLRAQEAIKLFHLTAVTVPETYMIGINEDMPQEATDNNTLIVQEHFPSDLVLVSTLPQQLRTLCSEAALYELFLIVIYAGLWDLTANLFFNPIKGTFIIGDLEQPNNSNPEDFFHKREAKVLGNIRCGIAHLNELFAVNNRLKVICQKFLKLTDQELKEIGSGQIPASLR